MASLIPTDTDQVEVDEDEIFISSASSSEDESETLYRLGLSSSSDGRSIRELICEGKRLLAHAERRSQPEPHRIQAAAVYRYNFSSSVTGADLFRERDLVELLDIVNTLKTRLSAERVFSLGCPQLRSERDVFDELLMRFSEEVLAARDFSVPDGSRNPANVEDGHPALMQTLPGTSVASQEQNIDTGNGERGGPSLPDRLQHPVTDEQSNSASQVQNGFRTVETSSVVEQLLKHVNDLKSLISKHTSAGNDGSFADSSAVQCLQGIQNSVSSLLGPSASTAQQVVPYTSPRRKKRRRSQEVEGDEKVKKCKTEKEVGQEDEEEDSCSICLEPWSTGGEHRITCLKCGHLFGLSCILKWVEQAHSCPQCKTAAKKSDLRNIFVRKITAEDTSERDRALRLLEEEKTARRSVEQKEAMARKKLDIQQADNEILRQEVKRLKSQLSESGGASIPIVAASQTPVSQSTSSTQSADNKRFHQFHRINIAADGSCRVFDYCKELGMVVVSQKSANALFRGYGIKILTRDFRPLSYQPLHSAVIRDMNFRPGVFDGMLLSCGMDKSIQLTSVTSKVVIQKFTVNSTVWCCAWNTRNTNLFYAGMERGVVKEYDIRRTDSHVQDLLDSGGSPISSMQYWGGVDQEGRNFQGLLIGQLQNLVFREETGEGQYTTHMLPHLQASLMSLSLHPSGKFLSSFRPGVNIPRCRYEICDLCEADPDSQEEQNERLITSARKAAWEGSNNQAVISRNCLMTRPESDGDLLAVTANHANNTVNVWDYQRKQDFQTLSCYDKAIDIKSVTHSGGGGGDLLGVLTDKDLVLYKWRQ